MICVSDELMQAKAKTMPISYLEDCRVLARIRPEDGQWCFSPSNYTAIHRKYSKYQLSTTAEHDIREPISGCCDRADQA